MYQALYRKWRPLRFADVIGQRHITDTLRAQLQSGRLSHAYLFTGTRGTGKTSCAKILARAVNCEHPVGGDPCNECAACRGILDGSVLDVVEIDAASNNGVDNIRDLREETRYTPAQVKKRVYIIDEVHMLSIGAFNALLKTLEEPPPHVLFILATTEIHKVPATILSRCQRFDFRRIGVEDIKEQLLHIAEQENIALSDEAARLIARLSDGAMRDALSMLDRAAASGAVTEEQVTQALGVLGVQDALRLVQQIQSGALAEAVALLDEYYEAGRDLAGVFDQLLGLIRDLLLLKTATQDVSALLSPGYSVQTLQKTAEGIASSTLLAWSQAIGDTLTRMRTAANRRIEAELCVVRLCSLRAEDYDTLGGRVEALEQKIKNGVPVALAAAPVPQPVKPTPPQDTPPATPAAEAETPEAPAAPQQDWPLWPQLLQALGGGKINTGAQTNLRLSARGIEEDGTLVILCEDSITATLTRHDQTIAVIREQAAALAGHPVRIKVRETKESAAPSHKQELDAITDRAKQFNIPVTGL